MSRPLVRVAANTINHGHGNTLSMAGKKAKKDIDTLKIDGVDHIVSDLSEAARAQIANIKYCDQQIARCQNEWAVADTARLAYTAALKNEAK